MNVLITGCHGQLGNEMQQLAKENLQHIYFFTDVVELDITNENAVRNFIQIHNIDCIVNCAAYTAVDKAESNVDLCNLLNNVAPGYLAKAVEEIFGVNVEKVNTVRVQGKIKRMGATSGKRADWKKAIVKLTAGSKTIEFFDGMA